MIILPISDPHIVYSQLFRAMHESDMDEKMHAVRPSLGEWTSGILVSSIYDQV